MRFFDLPDDMRDYTPAADILRQRGVSRVRLLSNNPEKISRIRGAGIEVVGTENIHLEAHKVPNTTWAYLGAKQVHGGHRLPLRAELVQDGPITHGCGCGANV